MSTKYHAFKGDMDTLETFLLEHQDILDKCSFEDSWRWIWNGKGANQTYVDTFTVHLSDEPITHEYEISKNKTFFEHYAVSRAIGHWHGELFKHIGDLKKLHDMDFGCSMGFDQGCFLYEQYTNKETIIKLAGLIQTEFDLKTRIETKGKGDYGIYIHSDQTVLDKLNIKEPTKVNKAVKKDNKEELLSEEQRLLEELEKVRKKLKK